MRMLVAEDERVMADTIAEGVRGPRGAHAGRGQAGQLRPAGGLGLEISLPRRPEADASPLDAG